MKLSLFGGIEVISIWPLIFVGAAAVLGMLSIAVKRSHAFVFALTLAGFIIPLALLCCSSEQVVTELLRVDLFSAFFMQVILAIAACVALLMWDDSHREKDEKPEEMYILLSFSVVGALTLVASNHFASLFLGLELMSIPIYGMLCYRKEVFAIIESGTKYIVLASVSTAFLVFGIAYLYAEVGALQFDEVAIRLIQITNSQYAVVAVGVGLIMVGIGFKLSLVPFHLWTADVYQGAATPAVTFLATVSKGASVVALLRILMLFNSHKLPELSIMLSLAAVTSMFAGSILALRETNLRRLLGYSSITNMGYLLAAALVGGTQGLFALIFFIVNYMLTTLGAFVALHTLTVRGEVATLDAVRGAFWRSPARSLAFAVALFSLLGVPLIGGGFFAKYLIVLASLQNQHWILLSCLVVTSVLALIAYWRVISAMLQDAPTPSHVQSYTRLSAAVCVAVSVIILSVGVAPTVLLNPIEKIEPQAPRIAE